MSTDYPTSDELRAARLTDEDRAEIERIRAAPLPQDRLVLALANEVVALAAKYEHDLTDAAATINGAYADALDLKDRLTAWSKRSGCIYCGEVLISVGIDGDKAERRRVYVEHTGVCPGHPMREVERERDIARADADRLAEAARQYRMAAGRMAGEAVDPFLMLPRPTTRENFVQHDDVLAAALAVHDAGAPADGVWITREEVERMCEDLSNCGGATRRAPWRPNRRSR